MSKSTEDVGGPRGSAGRIGGLAVTLVLAAYITSYILLSWQGIQSAKSHRSTTFFFFAPDSGEKRLNFTYVRLYYPLIVIDSKLIRGVSAASEDEWNRLIQWGTGDAGDD
jgi:hypothetical protein